MIALGHFAILRPWWLLALPVVALLFYRSKPSGGALAGWETAADSHLLAAMVARGAATGGKVRAPLILLTLLIGVLALAGPAIQHKSQDRLRNLDATVIVMDASSDMTGGASIREAASAAHDMLQTIAARQAGLIVYAGDAYVASALTDFTGAIDTDLFALDDQTVPDPGVRPDRALALAKTMLDEAHVIAGDVILISAGGGLDGTGATRQAAALAAEGHRVFTMDAASIALQAQSSRRAAALSAVATAGNGFGVSLLQPERLLETLANEAINRTDNSIVASLDWNDFGRFLLVFAAVPLLLGFRKVAAA